MELLELGPGDEVVLPSVSFGTSAFISFAPSHRGTNTFPVPRKLLAPR
jgi:hypothetical protein